MHSCWFYESFHSVFFPFFSFLWQGHQQQTTIAAAATARVATATMPILPTLHFTYLSIIGNCRPAVNYLVLSCLAPPPLQCTHLHVLIDHLPFLAALSDNGKTGEGHKGVDECMGGCLCPHLVSYWYADSLARQCQWMSLLRFLHTTGVDKRLSCRGGQSARGYEVQLAHDFYFIWKWTINLTAPKEQLSPSAFQLCLQHSDKRQCMWSAGTSPRLFLPFLLSPSSRPRFRRLSIHCCAFADRLMSS